MTTVFSPAGATVAVSASSTTASEALTVIGGSTQKGSRAVRIHNTLSEVAFIAFGNSAIEATTSDLPMPPGGVEVFEVSPLATHIAVITASGSGTVYATSGRGA